MTAADLWIVLVVLAVVGLVIGIWLIRRITSDADDAPSFWRYRRR